MKIILYNYIGKNRNMLLILNNLLLWNNKLFYQMKKL